MTVFYCVYDYLAMIAAQSGQEGTRHTKTTNFI